MPEHNTGAQGPFQRQKFEDHYHELAASRGLRCLNPNVRTVREKTRWQCLRAGHSLYLSYFEVQKRRGCPTCNSGAARLSAQDYAKLGHQFQCVRWDETEAPANRDSPTWWQCTAKAAHRYRDTYKRVHKRRGRCPLCRDERKTAPDHSDFVALAQRKQARWLGTIAPGRSEKTPWQCLICQQTIRASFDEVDRSSGCAGKDRRTPDDYRTLGSKIGYLWLGPEVCRSTRPTTWHCGNCDLPFAASYRQVESGHGCSSCADRLKASYQTAARLYSLRWIEEPVSSTPMPQRWQCQRCTRLFAATLEAVEAARGCGLCSQADASAAAGEYRALAAEKKCQWLGPTVLRKRIKTRWRSIQCGHEFWRSFAALKKLKLCPQCFALRHREAEHYRQLAAKHGLQWRGPDVCSTRKRTCWKCLKKGHVSWLSYHALSASKGCPKCVQASRRTPAQQYHDLSANLRLVRWLGPEVANQEQLTWWECTTQSAHRYQDTYERVRKRRGRCPVCRTTSGAAAQTDHVQDRVAKRAHCAHPALRDVDYSQEELAFIKAMEKFVQRTGNRNPSPDQILAVLSALGYEGPSIGENAVDQFVAAMEDFRRMSKRLFPTWTQVFTVLRHLGYRKQNHSDSPS
jgi:hypothetical protein